MENEDIKKQIEKYIKKIKPKYFNSKEINELELFLKVISKHIKELECDHEKVNKENILLKSKMNSIKYNLEKNNNIQNIIDNLKFFKK